MKATDTTNSEIKFIINKLKNWQAVSLATREFFTLSSKILERWIYKFGLKTKSLELALYSGGKYFSRGSEAALQMRPFKKVFWKYWANLQENIRAEVWFQ